MKNVNQYIAPGEILFSSLKKEIKTVVTFGITVTMHDLKKEIGALGHFLYPRRMYKYDSTALYAAPCIVGMLSFFEQRQSKMGDIEVQLVGAAHIPGSNLVDLSFENSKVAEEVLAKRGLKPHIVDLGGHRARRVIFNPVSGETLIAKVNKVRKEDWVNTGTLPLKRTV